MYKDRENNTIKVGNTLKNKHDQWGRVENIRGVTMFVERHGNGEIAKTTVFRKLDLSEWTIA